MRRLTTGLIAGALLAAAGVTVKGSSHREALAVLNEPCADNTDTYAWVSDGAHDKLYLVMDFNPLHEPGQGNQGLRACDGYRYEFHIGNGTSLKDKVVYRVEFTKRLSPEDPPSASDPLGGGNELLWQITGGTETMRVTRIVPRNSEKDTRTNRMAMLKATIPGQPSSGATSGSAEQSRTADRPPGVRPGRRSSGTTQAIPTSREVGLYDQNFVDSFIHTLSNGGRIIAGQFDDPYQLDEKGIFDLVNLGQGDVGGIPGARRGPIEDVFTGFNVFSIALEIPIGISSPAEFPTTVR